MSETAELESGVSLSMILFPSTLKYCTNVSVQQIYTLLPAYQPRIIFSHRAAFGGGGGGFFSLIWQCLP